MDIVDIVAYIMLKSAFDLAVFAYRFFKTCINKNNGL